MSPNTQVWHYTSLEAVIAMLRDRQMRLTRIVVSTIRSRALCQKRQLMIRSSPLGALRRGR